MHGPRDTISRGERGPIIKLALAAHPGRDALERIELDVDGNMGLFSQFLRRGARTEPVAVTSSRAFSAHERWLLERWYDEKLWKNAGYRANAAKLYDGFGWSLKKFTRRHAVEHEAISISDMIQFLIDKGHRVELGDRRAYVVGVEAVLFGRAYPIDYYEGRGD